jgi:hypothetical protein
MSISKINKYKMDHEKRGIALVVNMQTYEEPNPFKLAERKWSINDVKNLRKTLEYLEFDFQLCQNFTKTQVEQVVQEKASMNHEKSDCFLCVVMSHGNQDKIVTSDNKEMSFEEIMAPIKACKSLNGKPKIFLFQACRGENEMELVKDVSDTEPTPIVAEDSEEENMTDHQPEQHKFQQSQAIPTRKSTNIENESDLLLYYSTLPNHLSFSKESTEGTIFIKSVCDVLFNEAYKTCLTIHHCLK